MSGLARETRLQIMLEESELAAIDAWRFKHHMPSRAAAIRHLLRLGLGVTQERANPGMRSQDFGVFGAVNGRADEES